MNKLEEALLLMDDASSFNPETDYYEMHTDDWGRLRELIQLASQPDEETSDE